MMYDVIITSDMINFTDDTDSITVWSLSQYYYDNETQHHLPPVLLGMIRKLHQFATMVLS